MFQFDTEKVQQFGYFNQITLYYGVTGNLETKQIQKVMDYLYRGVPLENIDLNHSGKATWSGVTNYSFPKAFEELFQSHFDKFDVTLFETEETFVLPIGHCKRIKKVVGEMISISVAAGIKLSVFITDPATEIPMMVQAASFTGDNVHLDANLPGGSLAPFEIQLIETDLTKSSQACKHYDKQHLYAECVQNQLSEEFVPILGCMIPYMSPTNQCQGVQTVKNLTAFWLKLIPVIENWMIGGSPSNGTCLPPCRQTKVISKKLREIKNIGRHLLMVRFKPTVIVESFDEAYTLINLSVDFGSALGLWLGLSFLSAFDIIVNGSQKIKKSCDGLLK